MTVGTQIDSDFISKDEPIARKTAFAGTIQRSIRRRQSQNILESSD